MDLYVLRHGVAGERDARAYPDDGQRPLTPKGIKRMTLQVKGLNSIGIRPDLTLTSPLIRAIQTAEIVVKDMAGCGKLDVSDSLVPWAEPSEILEELGTLPPTIGSVMIVGHEPHLSRVVSLVATGSLDAGIRLRKGSLCKLRIPAPIPGRCGRIEWSLTPKQMIRMG